MHLFYSNTYYRWQYHHNNIPHEYYFQTYRKLHFALCNPIVRKEFSDWILRYNNTTLYIINSILFKYWRGSHKLITFPNSACNSYGWWMHELLITKRIAWCIYLPLQLEGMEPNFHTNKTHLNTGFSYRNDFITNFDPFFDMRWAMVHFNHSKVYDF